MFGAFPFGEPYFGDHPIVLDVEPPSFVSELDLEASYAPAITLTGSDEFVRPAPASFAPNATLRASVE